MGGIEANERKSSEYRELRDSIQRNINSLQDGKITRIELNRLKDRVSELTSEIQSSRSALDSVRSVEGVFSRMCSRLSSERHRLTVNSRNNLIIGIITSLVALGVLGLPLIQQASNSAISSTDLNSLFWRQYLTRLPVGLLLQFVAFFFLRLYVSCEMDIKHNKNEIN